MGSERLSGGHPRCNRGNITSNTCSAALRSRPSSVSGKTVPKPGLHCIRHPSESTATRSVPRRTFFEEEDDDESRSSDSEFGTATISASLRPRPHPCPRQEPAPRSRPPPRGASLASQARLSSRPSSVVAARTTGFASGDASCDGNGGNAGLNSARNLNTRPIRGRTRSPVGDIRRARDSESCPRSARSTGHARVSSSQLSKRPSSVCGENRCNPRSSEPVKQARAISGTETSERSRVNPSSSLLMALKSARECMATPSVDSIDDSVCSALSARSLPKRSPTPSASTGADTTASSHSADSVDNETQSKISSKWVEDLSWGRSFSKFVGDGYIPPALAERIAGLDLLEQLFIIRKEMRAHIRYEAGRLTVKRPSMNRGMNKPVTYASNIWNRGYANCAGNCIVFAAVLQKLGVPYCIVAVRSLQEHMPKHAIIEVGFPENTDIRDVNQRAKELWVEHYESCTTTRKDQDTMTVRRVKIFTGLKFTHSSPGSEAAMRKGVGHWLWVDPQARIGHYTHLVDRGYLIQSAKGFAFAVPPEIKTWREITCEAPEESGRGVDELEPESSNSVEAPEGDVKDETEEVFPLRVEEVCA